MGIAQVGRDDLKQFGCSHLRCLNRFRCLNAYRVEGTFVLVLLNLRIRRIRGCCVVWDSVLYSGRGAGEREKRGASCRTLEAACVGGARQKGEGGVYWDSTREMGDNDSSNN